MQITKRNTAVQVITPEYAMEIIASQPIIVIKFNRKTDPHIVQIAKEMPSVDHSVNIQISTDAMTEQDQGQFSIVMNVVAKKTPALIAQLTASGAIREIARTKGIEELISIYTASSRQLSHVADRFFETCIAHITSGHKVPIRIFDARDNPIASFETDTVTRFAWREMMAELREMQNQKTANLKEKR